MQSVRRGRAAKTAAFGAAVCAAAAGAALALGAPASAEPTFQSRHQDWTVWREGAGRSRVCFALSEPKDSNPKSVDHGSVGFLVATWANGSAREQPNLAVGYDLRPGAPTRAVVGRRTVRMFVDGREAFVEADGDERTLVGAMRRGQVMTVRTVSARGTQTSYEFSLLGVTAALRAVERACA